MKPLQRRVALVAGATRGAGRGIARMLGEAGATVYCSGRSSRIQPNTSTHHYAGRPETIEETAEHRHRRCAPEHVPLHGRTLPASDTRQVADTL
jgi:NAD(P)-dependent dehydrogenase (short-subunit alcohol dehydrogenase family)